MKSKVKVNKYELQVVTQNVTKDIFYDIITSLLSLMQCKYKYKEVERKHKKEKTNAMKII